MIALQTAFSRTPFLTEHINKRLTFSVFIIQGKETQKKFNRAFDQYIDFFLFQTQNINTPHKKTMKLQNWLCMINSSLYFFFIHVINSPIFS